MIGQGYIFFVTRKLHSGNLGKYWVAEIKICGTAFQKRSKSREECVTWLSHMRDLANRANDDPTAARTLLNEEWRAIREELRSKEQELAHRETLVDAQIQELSSLQQHALSVSMRKRYHRDFDVREERLAGIIRQKRHIHYKYNEELDIYVFADGTIVSGKQNKILSQFKDKGRPYINLRRNNVTTCYYVHRLVAEAFVKDYTPDCIVKHINGNLEDNRPQNLQCLTKSECARMENIARTLTHDDAVKELSTIETEAHLQLEYYKYGDIGAIGEYIERAIRPKLRHLLRYTSRAAKLEEMGVHFLYHQLSNGRPVRNFVSTAMNGISFFRRGMLDRVEANTNDILHS